MMILALALSSAAHAAALGDPIASAEEGHTRLSLSLAGEVPPGQLPKLPTKALRLDLVPFDHFGVFVDGNWTNSLEDKFTGERRRVWQVGLGARAQVNFTRTLGVGVIGRAGYGHDWIVQPFYLADSSSPTDVITSDTTDTSGTTDTGDTTASDTTTSTKDPLFPAWARGVRTDEAQRMQGRTVAAVTFGEPGTGVYAWAGAHFTVNAARQVGVELGEGASWSVSTNPRPVGATAGFELISADILGWGDVRDRYISGGFEVHLIDVTGASLWIGYAW